MILPTILCAGFPRCGTTWIGRALSQHPELNVPLKKHPSYDYLVKKELNYFNEFPGNFKDQSTPNKAFHRNFTEYLSYWVKDKINVDFSICTAYDEHAIERVKEILGEPKIIFFVRDKLDHQESIKVLAKSNKVIDCASEFEKLMQPYREQFENYLVINLEDVKENPRAELKKILLFVGAQDINFKFDLSGPKHSSKDLRK